MNKIPITLITGFLGAGKSTLINRILKENNSLKFGLIVNEFGDVNLESQIIKTSGEDIVELSNGCMCCVIRKDLVSTVEKLIANSPNLDYILIEASGLSDPLPIAQTFLMQNLENKIRLDSILCIVDSLNFEKNSDNYKITSAQLQFADIIILSKTDLVPKEKVETIKGLIMQLFPLSKIFEDARKVDLSLIIDTSKYDHENIKELEEEYAEHEKPEHIHEHLHEEEEECEEDCEEEHEHHHSHNHVHEHVETLFFKSNKKIDSIKFQKIVDNLPDGVVRAKGFIQFGEGIPNSDMKYIMQFVGARKQFMLDAWKEDENKQTALVFIGKEFSTVELENKIRECEL